MFSILFNLAGLFVILFIIWWFWLAKKEQALQIGSEAISILVENGVYKPAAVQTKKGQPVVLRFIRKDENPCAGTVVFADLDMSAELPVGEPYDLELAPQQAGEFEFTCQMGMYRGRLIVTE